MFTDFHTKRLSWVDNIFRVRGPFKTRLNKLRLDKNERVSNFERKFLNRTLKKIKPEHLIAYPETEPLYDLLAKKLNVSRKSLVITAGADSALRSCFDLCVKPGDKVVTLSPTFAMVDIYVKFSQARQIKIKYNSNLKLDFKKLINSINSKVSLVVFANPNSPTGTILNHKQIIDILTKAYTKGVMVLIDEAYFGFSKYTALPLLKRFSNLIIARTFSKSFGLAGCRAGYLISQPKIASRLYRLRPMYEVNSIAILMVTALLKNEKFVRKYLNETNLGKKYLISKLKSLKINYLETHANFLHIDFGRKKKIFVKLFSKNNILIKGGPGVKGYDSYLRITLGPKKYMQPVINIIESKSIN
jgi:histidinol-phosphate aminotransferase